MINLKIIKYILVLTFFMYLFYSNYQDKINKKEVDFNFNNVVEKIFINYSPEVKVITNKLQVRNYFIFIDKNKLNNSNFLKLNSVIKKYGWILIDSNGGFYKYCIGEKYYMTVDLDYAIKNKIEILYSKGGISDCK